MKKSILIIVLLLVLVLSACATTRNDDADKSEDDSIQPAEKAKISKKAPNKDYVEDEPITEKATLITYAGAVYETGEISKDDVDNLTKYLSDNDNIEGNLLEKAVEADVISEEAADKIRLEIKRMGDLADQVD